MTDDQPQALSLLLRAGKTSILASGADMLRRARRPHYVVDTGPEAKLERLFDRIEDAIERSDVRDLIGYVRTLAGERFATGFQLGEVQMAFNCLEQAIWRSMAAAMEPADVGAALAIVTSVFGAAKDALARAYVVDASRSGAPALDLARISAGTEPVELSVA
jgi:hypothetical protein